MGSRGTPIERVWRRVERGDPTSCWPWTGAVRPDGYGEVRVNQSLKLLAHRVIDADEHGPIPDGIQVHHSCQHRWCCNPAHFERMTGEEHTQLHRG